MKGEDTKEVKLEKDLQNTNWEEFDDCVKSLLTEGRDFETKDADSSLFLLKVALRTVSEQHIPVKKVCCLSKSYWTQFEKPRAP